jgi:hypothetical protein
VVNDSNVLFAYLFQFYFVAEDRQRKCVPKIYLLIIIENDNLNLNV